MRSQVLEHIQLQQVNGAFQMALDRVNESLVKYSASGAQGSLSETLFAVNQIKKLRAEMNAELLANQPKPESDNKSEVLALLALESEQANTEELATIPTSSKADYAETTSNQSPQDTPQDTKPQDQPSAETPAPAAQPGPDEPASEPGAPDAAAPIPAQQPNANPFHAA